MAECIVAVGRSKTRSLRRAPPYVGAFQRWRICYQGLHSFKGYTRRAAVESIFVVPLGGAPHRPPPNLLRERCSPDSPLGGVAASQTSLDLGAGGRWPPTHSFLIFVFFVLFGIVVMFFCFVCGGLLALGGDFSIYLENFKSNAQQIRSGELFGAELWLLQFLVALRFRSPSLALPRLPLARLRSLARPWLARPLGRSVGQFHKYL